MKKSHVSVAAMIAAVFWVHARMGTQLMPAVVSFMVTPSGISAGGLTMRGFLALEFRVDSTFSAGNSYMTETRRVRSLGTRLEDCSTSSLELPSQCLARYS